MSDIEFLGFIGTPLEKHAAIATVRVSKSIVLRFKIVPKKDGSGYFPTTASFKVPDEGGGDSYIEAFMLDSRSENDEMNRFIMNKFKVWQTNKSSFTSTKDLKNEEEIPF